MREGECVKKRVVASIEALERACDERTISWGAEGVEASSFGHPQGWPSQEVSSAADQHRILDVLSADVREEVRALLTAGRRIPEEVLGADELRCAWP